MRFSQKSFAELTTTELFRIYQLRVAVFVVEQDCVYQEVDDDDLIAQHLFRTDDAGQVLAYARLIPEPNQVRIGRVLVAAWNGSTGRSRVGDGCHCCRSWGYPQAQQIVIQAQSYAKFYTRLGLRPPARFTWKRGSPLGYGFTTESLSK